VKPSYRRATLVSKTTTFKKKFIKKVDEYLKHTKDKFKKKSLGKKNGLETFDFNFVVQLPSKEDFANYIGVSRKTLYNWADENPAFADALDKIEVEQKKRLINSGLSGTYNSTIAKLILSSNHGMSDRIDATSKGESINPFNDEQIDRIADRIASRKGSNGHTPS